MNEQALTGGEVRGLSQVERVADTFVAPKATFTDILRSASWWMPFLLVLIVSTFSTYSIDKHVGFDRVAENSVQASPKQTEQMADLAPPDRALQMQRRAMGTRYFSYGFPLFLLIGLAVYAAIMLGIFNFGLGAKMTFNQSMAVTVYASLPYLVTSLLTILTVTFGNNAETFNIQNPVGTNPAYFIDAAPWLKALLGSFDIVRLWSLVLTVIGYKIVARKSTVQAAAVVVGFWLLAVVLGVAVAAMFA